MALLGPSHWDKGFSLSRTGEAPGDPAPPQGRLLTNLQGGREPSLLSQLRPRRERGREPWFLLQKYTRGPSPRRTTPVGEPRTGMLLLGSAFTSARTCTSTSRAPRSQVCACTSTPLGLCVHECARAGALPRLHGHKHVHGHSGSAFISVRACMSTSLKSAGMCRPSSQK